ncbi:MAG: transmembrane 220 family protein [Burkholderiaceae bacterium]
MRILNMVLGLLMVVFAAVQLNDPDTFIWIVYYLIGATWALMAAFKLNWVQSAIGRILLWLSLAVAFAGVIVYFPKMDKFWERDVWWVEETAREGMGIMILFLVLLAVLIHARSASPVQN